MRTSGSTAQPQTRNPKATMADQAKVDLFHGALNFGLQFLGLGHLQLKEKQYEVLKHVVLNNRDVLAVLPTGYGKSLTYQMLPPVLNFVDFGAEEKKATVIVISPLNALIRDQIVKMRESGLSVCVLRGDRVDTEDGGDEEISLEVPVEMLTSAHFDLIFTHPEVLVDNRKVSKLLKTTSFKEKIKAIVVDEANLVIDWYVDTFKLCSNKLVFSNLADAIMHIVNSPFSTNRDHS